MCFSAGASFGVSAALLAGGIASLKYTQQPKQIPFAAIPLIFSVQQFCEGVLWLSFENAAYHQYKTAFTYVFLIFAQVVWPTWIPLSMSLMEKAPHRKKFMTVFLIAGIISSLFLAYCIVNYPVSASVGSHHIRYDLDFPLRAINFMGILYFIPTVISPIISTVNKMWMVGVANLLSYLSAQFIFGDYIISIWCFFAAAISIGIFYIMRRFGRFDN